MGAEAASPTVALNILLSPSSGLDHQPTLSALAGWPRQAGTGGSWREGGGLRDGAGGDQRRGQWRPGNRPAGQGLLSCAPGR